MVASEAAIATQVGRDVLAHGGNAADAAVATCFALAVVHPSAGNLGGGGFAVVRTKDEARALDFRETAPEGATPDMFVHAGSGASLRGDLASGVPGTVAGLWELHVWKGKRTWQEDLAPAIALARDGFAVDPILAKGLERRLARAPINAGPWSMKHAAGEIVKQPELAETLQRISDQGPSGFYQGPVAEAIATEMQQHGGLITLNDLKGYQALWRDPLRFDYRGKHLITMPPPSSGGIVIAMTANMLAGTDLAKLGWHSTEHVHWLVEVWRRAYAARNELLGDPGFVQDMPIAHLMSKEFADAMVATIGPRATPSKQVAQLLEGTHTTNVSIVDAGGMAIALTFTLNTSYGSGVWVAGFLMNNEMDDFTTLPGTPNAYGLIQGKANQPEPGKRMLSSMSPTIIEDDHGVFMVVGGQGGSRIITEVWQTISNVIDFGLPVEAAISAPRVHHQHLPDEVVVEQDALSQPTANALRAAGYMLVEGAPERIYGAANAIVRTQNGWRGAADPRNGGAAMGD
ncbi:MAG: gamma-glutamyltransferase [Deltaproteobacteria bacterium]|nr:gamma-glutamyltransferase [Deltaproteobacteria bacterium]